MEKTLPIPQLDGWGQNLDGRRGELFSMPVAVLSKRLKRPSAGILRQKRDSWFGLLFALPDRLLPEACVLVTTSFWICAVCNSISQRCAVSKRCCILNGNVRIFLNRLHQLTFPCGRRFRVNRQQIKMFFRTTCAYEFVHLICPDSDDPSAGNNGPARQNKNCLVRKF